MIKAESEVRQLCLFINTPHVSNLPCAADDCRCLYSEPEADPPLKEADRFLLRCAAEADEVWYEVDV